MRVLLTGANGQVGWEITRRAAAYGLELDARERAGLDISNAAAIADAVQQADLVINAAAYTAVDRAEQESALAFAANQEGPLLLAEACAKRGIPLFHLSTDYVFDGRKTEPYTEQDVTCPLGVYGQSKLGGELGVQLSLQQYLIMRVSWVFSAHGNNFVKTILRLAKEREQLRIVADQHGCPTWAGHIAQTLLELAQRHAQGQDVRWGTYHYTGQPAVNWYQFACAIVEQARARGIPLAVQEITPITTADYPTPAARPANSVLDCRRIQQRLGLSLHDWQLGLAEVLDGYV